jgi:hypothetical protein
VSRDAATAAAAVAAVVLLAVLISPWSPLTRKAAPDGLEGTTWSPSQPRVGHYARGGLWHPPVAGQGRTALIRNGWAWIASPPSEVTGPGVDDG